jgi:Cu2+-exporting ATPase
MMAAVTDKTAAVSTAGTEALAAGDMPCFHCGLPVPPGSHWSVVIDHMPRAMCCPGCEAVAQAIVDNGLDNYYRNRQQLPDGAAGSQQGVPDALKLYDTPELASQFVNAQGDAEALLSVEGIRCAACVWLIEKRLSQLPGLQSASLNVSTEKLQVRWDAAQCKTSDILQAVREVGYVAYPYDPIQHGELLRKNARTLFKRLFVAGLSMMQVMMYAVPSYVAEAGAIEPDMESLMRWASLALTAPAVFYSALPFYRGAWSDLKARAPGMDVPVALGIAAGFIGSVWATVTGQGDVYFDSVTMFIFLLLGSRYLELVARRRAAVSLERLQHALPDAAWRASDWPAARDVQQVAAAQLRAGDVILAKPGETIPADSVLIDGETAVDLSLLTGESKPQPRRIGESVAGGAVNISHPVWLRVDRVARDSTLAALVRLVERAGQGKPKIAQWADRVAAWFVAALLLLALAVFAFWYWHDAARAWPVAIAVLVVSCPCALSLATPSALAAASERLLCQRVLVIQPHVLETLHRATHIVFDKTGTLTEGKPSLQRTVCTGRLDEASALRIAAALESGSAHPIAQAFVATGAGKQHALPQATGMESVPGRGIAADIDGDRWRLGSAAWVAALAGEDRAPVSASNAAAVTEVFLGRAGEWVARFELVDAIKPDALATMTWFRARGCRTVLLSGDAEPIATEVGRSLQMDQAHGGMLPAQKMAFVQQLQQQGAVVAMVGDGINDAAVLRVADVSFAMGSGAALAQSHADAVLLNGSLSSLLDAARAAADGMRVIRQNLWWATLYNLVAIPAAAWGLLTPWMAGVGMSASSALVVLNALRLQRIRSRRG